MDGKFLFFSLADSVRKKLRDEKLTLKQAADKTKVSPSTLSKLMRGQTIPDTRTLVNLSDWLELSIDQLLKIPHQLVLDNNDSQLQLEIHFRAKRKKLDAYPDEVQATIIKMVRLAYKQFMNPQDNNG